MLARLAVSIEQGQPTGFVQHVLADAQAQCEQAAVKAPADLKMLLANFMDALRAWYNVWPTMGARPEFRQAVSREARQWSHRVLEPPTS
ncbi:MAG: hypothetical protein HYY91_03065 [Candidatus Omnitrophica bacterium]|nr:hypothetical protein [Candidatus Omnitrophota bacterium]